MVEFTNAERNEAMKLHSKYNRCYQVLTPTRSSSLRLQCLIQCVTRLSSRPVTNLSSPRYGLRYYRTEPNNGNVNSLSHRPKDRRSLPLRCLPSTPRLEAIRIDDIMAVHCILKRTALFPLDLSWNEVTFSNI